MNTASSKKCRCAVHTARVNYKGTDRLDMTRKSAGIEGLPFAPSWRIVGPIIRLRREGGSEAFAAAWDAYVENYTTEMRESYRVNRAQWDTILDREEVTLVCYCRDHQYCHRTLLGRIFEKLGAQFRGERPAHWVVDPKAWRE